MTKVYQLPNYVKAVKESLKPRSNSLYQDCLNADLAEIKGDVIYFRNYEDADVAYIEFCFTRIAIGNIKFNYVSYRPWTGEEDY